MWAPQSAHQEDDAEERGHAECEECPDEEEGSAGIGDVAADADTLVDPKAKLGLPVTCRSKPGEAAIHWPIRYSTPQNLCPVQPTAGKACSLQSAHQSGHFAGGVPDDPRFVIRDHA